MNKKVMGGVLVLFVAVLAYVYASPYLVLNSIKHAAQAGDSEKVSAYIDYPSVRQSFKDQINAQMMKDVVSDQKDGWEALGAMVATTMIDKMVDSFVSPQGMTLLMQGKDFKESLPSPQDHRRRDDAAHTELDYRTRYLSINVFEATLKNTDAEQSVKIIMARDGLSWKIKKFVVAMDDQSSPPATQTSTSVQNTVVEQPIATRPVAQTEPRALFDHSGMKQGKVMEFCYRDPCATAKVVDFQILNQTTSDVDVELTLLGGSKGWEDDEIAWSDQTHRVQITCSMEKPTVRIEGQVTVIPFDEFGVPGVYMTDAEMYLHTCHGNFNGTVDEAVSHYGYQVHTE